MVAKQVIAGLVAAVLLGCAAALAAQSKPAPGKGDSPKNAHDKNAQAYILDIPRLPIIDALKEFTTQTGLQISFWPDAQTDQTALVGPLRGKFTAEVALTRLLSASGLAFKRTNDRSLVVMAPSLMGAPRNGVTHFRAGTVPPRRRATVSPAS